MALIFNRQVDYQTFLPFLLLELRFFSVMIRTVLFAGLFLVIASICIPFHLTAGENNGDKPVSLASQYEEAKSYYNQLQTNSSLSQSRENWLKGTRNFRRIYLSNPKADIAPSCLYMLGRVYHDMFEKFQNGIDLDEAISYFKDMVRLFPQHRLADDALLVLAQITLDKRNNPQEAAEYLTEIVTNHPNGDKYAEAENRLKMLSQQNDIQLPQVMVSSSRPDKLNYVLPVKYWSSDSYTRVVIMASGPVSYKEILLEQTENTPRRLYIDFKKSYIEPQYRAPVPIEDGLLRRIRTGQFSPDTVRVVLDIESISSYKIFSLPDPFRVVIDVRGEKKGEKMPLDNLAMEQSQNNVAVAPIEQPKVNAIVPSAEQTKVNEIEKKSANDIGGNIVVLRDNKKSSPSKKSPAEPVITAEAVKPLEAGKIVQPEKAEKSDKSKPLTLAQQLGLGVKKIVLDPGHGGKDPGAMAYGLKEKDVVLNIAKQLAPVLAKELGCEVILTRPGDTFITLEERTAIANTQNADLFISLHINASSSTKARGLETYYLNLTTNAEAMKVAARENATSTHQMSELQNILSDILKNSKINESSRLAQQVHSNILNHAEKKGFADIKNLGVKKAPFYVLIGAQMPAILIEIAFISNEQDSHNLNNPAFVKMLTQEISHGIRAYVNDTTAQLSKN
jgi:N-acetylmuramoyl-L-alanine amidase